MLCPKCEKTVRFSDEEKQRAKSAGFVLHTCSTCGHVFRASYTQMLKTKERKAYLIEHGICVYCATRQADEGYHSCKPCRDKMGQYRFRNFSSITNDIEAEMEEVREMKKAMPHKMTLEEISAAAAKEGISYGEYVAKHGL